MFLFSYEIDINLKFNEIKFSFSAMNFWHQDGLYGFAFKFARQMVSIA
jgi:hypothetical protein